jgi:hypothetical protein
VQPRLARALSRFDDPQQFGAAVRDAVLFLTAGTLYSDVPYEKVARCASRTAASAWA